MIAPNPRVSPLLIPPASVFAGCGFVILMAWGTSCACGHSAFSPSVGLPLAGLHGLTAAWLWLRITRRRGLRRRIVASVVTTLVGLSAVWSTVAAATRTVDEAHARPVLAHDANEVRF